MINRLSSQRVLKVLETNSGQFLLKLFQSSQIFISLLFVFTKIQLFFDVALVFEVVKCLLYVVRIGSSSLLTQISTKAALSKQTKRKNNVIQQKIYQSSWFHVTHSAIGSGRPYDFQRSLISQLFKNDENNFFSSPTN